MELKERTNYPYQQYPVRYPYEIFRARARQDDRPPVNPEKYDSLGPPGGDAAQNSSFDFFKKFGKPIGKPNFKRTLMLNDRFDTKMKDHHWIQSKSNLPPSPFIIPKLVDSILKGSTESGDFQRVSF